MTSGIYGIKNTINNKIYIGSSKNIEERFKQHISALNHNKHCNIHLQRSWIKHGEINFEFLIIKECNIEVLFENEEYYINNTDNNLLYNLGSVGGGDNTSRHPNNKQIREKISAGVSLRY